MTEDQIKFLFDLLHSSDHKNYHREIVTILLQVDRNQPISTKNYLMEHLLLSDDYLVCVKGPLPLLGKYRNAREAVVSAANLPPALKLSHRFDHLIETAKNKLNIDLKSK
jgi:hypothetical protein